MTRTSPTLPPRPPDLTYPRPACRPLPCPPPPVPTPRGRNFIEVAASACADYRNFNEVAPKEGRPGQGRTWNGPGPRGRAGADSVVRCLVGFDLLAGGGGGDRRRRVTV